MNDIEDPIGEAEKPQTLRSPVLPPQTEIDAHSLTHQTFRKWCRVRHVGINSVVLMLRYYLPDPYCFVTISCKARHAWTGSGINYDYLGRAPPPLVLWWAFAARDPQTPKRLKWLESDFLGLTGKWLKSDSTMSRRAIFNSLFQPFSLHLSHFWATFPVNPRKSLLSHF